MKKSSFILSLALALLMTAGFTACKSDQPKHEPWTQELIDALEQDTIAKALLIKSIDIARSINPDPATNPSQTLEDYYNYLDWSTKCLPWSVIPQPAGRTLYDKIDQSVDYFYFVLDIPLDELRDRDLSPDGLGLHDGPHLPHRPGRERQLRPLLHAGVRRLLLLGSPRLHAD